MNYSGVSKIWINWDQTPSGLLIFPDFLNDNKTRT